MTKPNVLVFSGYGLNCEEETKFAFEVVGASADIIHVNDVIERKNILKKYQIVAMPGGFSYGDDMGSGRAFANKVKNNLKDQLDKFLSKDTLAIGICNGFQIFVGLGFFGQMALINNNSVRYEDRWVDLEVLNNTPWLRGIKKISMPVAHGEGKFFADEKTLEDLSRKNLIAVKYVKGEMCEYQRMTKNPNGSLEDVAGVTDRTGRILGMMPHPERAMFFTQLPNWPKLKEKYLREKKNLPKYADGIKIFQNAVDYFK